MAKKSEASTSVPKLPKAAKAPKKPSTKPPKATSTKPPKLPKSARTPKATKQFDTDKPSSTSPPSCDEKSDSEIAPVCVSGIVRAPIKPETESALTVALNPGGIALNPGGIALNPGGIALNPGGIASPITTACKSSDILPVKKPKAAKQPKKPSTKPPKQPKVPKPPKAPKQPSTKPPKAKSEKIDSDSDSAVESDFDSDVDHDTFKSSDTTDALDAAKEDYERRLLQIRERIMQREAARRSRRQLNPSGIQLNPSGIQPQAEVIRCSHCIARNTTNDTNTTDAPQQDQDDALDHYCRIVNGTKMETEEIPLVYQWESSTGEYITIDSREYKLKDLSIQNAFDLLETAAKPSRGTERIHAELFRSIELAFRQKMEKENLMDYNLLSYEWAYRQLMKKYFNGVNLMESVMEYKLTDVWCECIYDTKAAIQNSLRLAGYDYDIYTTTSVNNSKIHPSQKTQKYLGKKPYIYDFLCILFKLYTHAGFDKPVVYCVVDEVNKSVLIYYFDTEVIQAASELPEGYQIGAPVCKFEPTNLTDKHPYKEVMRTIKAATDSDWLTERTEKYAVVFPRFELNSTKAFVQHIPSEYGPEPEPELSDKDDEDYFEFESDRIAYEKWRKPKDRLSFEDSTKKMHEFIEFARSRISKDTVTTTLAASTSPPTSTSPPVADVIQPNPRVQDQSDSNDASQFDSNTLLRTIVAAIIEEETINPTNKSEIMAGIKAINALCEQPEPEEQHVTNGESDDELCEDSDGTCGDSDE